MTTLSNRRLVLYMALVAAAFSYVGCMKNDQTLVMITVKDENGINVPNASVRLYGRPSSGGRPGSEVRLDTTVVADNRGKVTLEYSEYIQFGQSGFAVLDIQAWKGDLSGTGLVHVEPEELVKEIVFVE